MNWQIEQGCPQCGAPATLAETDHLLACAYCRTRLYLVPNGPFRYHLPPAASANGDLIYLPYWRSRGVAFTVTAADVSGRIADTSRLAFPLPSPPPSLGLRTQALKLRFVSPETPGRFIAPALPVREAVPVSRHLPRGVLYRNFVSETQSLIHAPFFLRGETLCDGILDRPLAVVGEEAREKLAAASEAPPSRVRFIPTHCPHCGWDMEGERGSLVLICRNCESAWHCPRAVFEPVSFSVLPPPAGSGEIARYLPFWRMRPRFTGLALNSRADLVRLANLPRAITADLEEAPLFFWSPAFKIHPALYARWCHQMTVFSPTDAGTGHLPAPPLHPATLALAEAAEAIPLTIAQLIADKGKDYPALAGLRADLEEAHLEYHPFQAQGSELRHPRLGVVLHRTALAFGGGL